MPQFGDQAVVLASQSTELLRDTADGFAELTGLLSVLLVAGLVVLVLFAIKHLLTAPSRHRRLVDCLTRIAQALERHNGPEGPA